MRSTIKALSFAVAVSVASVASAATIIPVSATGSSDRIDYPSNDAIDTDAGSNVSDWATANQGAGATLRLDLGGVATLGAFNLVDRVTSGAGNGSFVGGTTDFTNSFTIQAYTDATFSTALGPLFSFSKATPTGPTNFDSFAFSGVLGGVKAQYVLYTVTGTDGGQANDNAGLSNIAFATGVPEPATWAMMILGFGFVGAALRTRRSPAALAA